MTALGQIIHGLFIAVPCLSLSACCFPEIVKLKKIVYEPAVVAELVRASYLIDVLYL